MHWLPLLIALACGAAVAGYTFPLLALATLTPIIYAHRYLAERYPEREDS